MLTTLLDFFCSRPFPETPSPLRRLLASWGAWLWAAVAFGVGLALGGDFAVPGENAHALAVFSGAAPSAREAYPILWWLAGLLGEVPSMRALNLLGSAVMALTAAMTWLTVRFWALDAMSDETGAKAAGRLSAAAAHVACALFLFSLPGLYAGTGLTTNLWGFALLLACVALQNTYALGGGHRRTMALFGLLLGVAAVESPYVLAALPLFFLRALAMEWRLWDHSARNLPLWFLSLVVGVALMLWLNGLRVLDTFTFAGAWEAERRLLLAQVGALQGFFRLNGWLIDLLGVGAAPLLAWITARRLLDNGRSWGLLITAAALTAAAFGLYWGIGPTPWKTWLIAGTTPVATLWVATVCCGMLLVGWGVQLFAKNPNIYEELDRRRIPASVTACRVAAIFLFPLCVVAACATAGVQTARFLRVDRALADRFAGETVGALAKGSGSPAEGRSYLLGSTTYWIDPHLALVAQARGVPLTLFCPARMEDKAYLEALRRQLETDPLLGDADRLRLTNLLAYNFLVFVQDFFVAQPNAAQIAAVYDLADVWYGAHLRPLPAGTVYVPAPGDGEGEPPLDRLLADQRALQGRWAKTLATKPGDVSWWDLTAGVQRALRAHLAFMANNLGTVLDDAGRLADAASCYLYAAETDAQNISAKLNLYDICVRRGQLPERRIEVNRVFEEFIREQSRGTRRYDLSAVGRRHGYIRNYDLFVNMGWTWAVSAAPESILAGLRNAQEALQPGDPRLGAVQAVAAAVYEFQGQTERSYDSYRAAIKADPDNVEALRGLARLSIQRGDTAEAGQWLAKVEAAGGDAANLDIDRTAYLMARGDLEGAAKAISRYTSKNQDAVIGWAMLGMLEMERADRARAENREKDALDHYDRARGFILKNLKRTAQGKDLYFLHVMEGRLAQSDANHADALSRDEKALPSPKARGDSAAKAKKLWEEARGHYRRAYATRPNVRGIMELILELDRRLGDKPAAEADALALLRDDANHGFANFIVGTQRLEDGHVDAAVRYFAAAVDAEKTPAGDIHNNYADALARTDAAKAKEVALRAIAAAPESFATWGTYALALARAGEPDKAQTALDKAHALIAQSIKDGRLPADFKPDPRLGYVDAWIAVGRRDLPAAKKARDAVSQAIGGGLTPLDRRDLDELDARVNARL